MYRVVGLLLSGSLICAMDDKRITSAKDKAQSGSAEELFNKIDRLRKLQYSADPKEFDALFKEIKNQGEKHTMIVRLAQEVYDKKKEEAENQLLKDSR